MDGELIHFGAKGPELEANNNCSPTSSFVSCFLHCNCHFSIFPLTVIVVVVTLVAN